MTMTRILFVCHGNICRSPMAEFIMRDLVEKNDLSDRIEISSCATSSEELGNPMYPPAKEILSINGVGFTDRQARRMTKEDYSRYDMIFAMDENNISNMRQFIGDDAEHKVSLLMECAGEKRGISDPWYTGDFERTYDDIRKACVNLLCSIRSYCSNETDCKKK